MSVRVLMTIMAMLAPASAMAGPMGEQYRGGTSLVSRPDNITTLILQQSQKAVIDWNSFSIGSNEEVKVEQPGSDSILLNRVVGTSPSEIFGSLIANGQVFVVNPHGVVFAPGSHVDVHGLMATTMSISPSTFMAVSDGNYIFTDVTDGQVKTVTNQGTLTATDGGYIVLAGDTVDNSGSIAAQSGQVALASGSKMTLDLAGDQLISLEVDLASLATTAGVENTASGVLMADGGRVVMTAKTADTLIGTVVNNQGQVRARTIQEQGGEILLLGDMDHGTVEVAGTLDASSAPTGGNGGTIETSGHRVTVADNTTVTTAAGTGGARGKWRLRDEVDFFIGADGAAMLDGGGMSGTTLSNALKTTNVVIERTGPPATGSTIPTTAAQKTMASAITSASATADLGDIVVGSEVSWDTDSTLALQANNNVVVNAPIKNIGSGEIILRADLDADNSGTVAFNLGSSTGSLMIGGQASIFYNPAYYSDYDLKQGYFSTYVAATSTGTLNTFMLVNDIDHLQDINTNLSASYALGQDIDATVTKDWNGGAGFVPLGPGEGVFMGTFTGNGHTISHLFINTPNALGPTGLFGIASGSDIRDVGLVDANITGNIEVGALIGRNFGEVSDAYSMGTVAGADDIVGGLIGYNEGPVTNSYSESSVLGHSSYVGGLIGENHGSINFSHSTGDVDSWNDYVGGLIGFNDGEVSDSYSTGAVNGDGDSVGGLIGYNDNFGDISNSGNVTNSYSTGNVTGGEYSVGGLIGENYGSVSQSYGSGDVVGYGSYIGGLIGYNEGDVADSHSTSSVTGDTSSVDSGALEGSYYSVGGLLGENYGAVSGSYSSGNVSGYEYSVGGLIGYNEGDISDSHSTSSVTGDADSVGGLVGENYGAISKSYSTGTVDGSGNVVGGLLGYNEGGDIVESYSTSAVTGTSYVGGLIGYNYLYSGIASISRTYSTGTVTGSGDYVGGLIGAHESGVVESADIAMITGSYSSGAVTGNQYVGGLIGHNTNGVVMDSHSTGAVTGSHSVGGLIGYNYYGLITNTYNSGSVVGADQKVGGLIGANDWGTINSSYNAGKVTGGVNAVDAFGGLVGFNTGIVLNSYSTGAVTGTESVGGLVGNNDAGSIVSSYSTGAVSGTNDVGGLVGYDTSGGESVINSFWDKETSGQSVSAGGQALTTVQMLDDSSFTGWDFTAEGVWWLSQGNTRPFLRSEYNTTIANAHQLQLMALDLGADVTYTLGGNILMDELAVQSGMWNTGTGFVPVSDATTQFAGTFDGAGHTITGLFINRPTTQYVGLFGGAQDNSLLKDVGLIDVNITGGFQTGGLAAHLGVGTIERAYTTGTVTGTSNTVGGLVGLNAGEISDSYSTATVKGQTYVGGLVGSNWGGNSAITRSYSAGKVSGVSSVGGLVGTNFQTTANPVMDSYWNVETSQQTSSAGGTGLTTAEMKDPSSYPGWDFATTWRIYAGVTYPLLKGFLSPLAITIMANDASRIYGEQNPVFDKTILGAYDPAQLQGWDTLQLTSEAGLYSPVGNYAIVPSGQLSSTVYDIIFQDGTLTVTPRPLTLIDPIQVADKVYDGNQFATVTSYGALAGVVADDLVSVAGSTATFDTKDVGTEKQVTITDFVLGGAAANNYIVDPETVLTSLAEITAKPLSVAIIGNPTKVYDGTKIAHLTPANFDLNEFVPGEDATISQATGQYASPEVGSHTVTSALTKTDFIPVTGTSLANYLLPTSAAGPGKITEKPAPEKPPVVDEIVVKEKAKDEVAGVTSEIIASTIPEDLTKESMESEGGSKGPETANGEGDASDENKEKEKKVGGNDSDQENELKEQPLLSLDSGAVAGQNMVCK